MRSFGRTTSTAKPFAPHCPRLYSNAAKVDIDHAAGHYRCPCSFGERNMQGHEETTTSNPMVLCLPTINNTVNWSIYYSLPAGQGNRGKISQHSKTLDTRRTEAARKATTNKTKNTRSSRSSASIDGTGIVCDYLLPTPSRACDAV